MRIFSLTHEAVSQQGWALGEDRDGLQVEVPTGGGRTQVVYLEPGTDRDGDTIAWIWSKAADSEAIDDPWGLLALNAQLSYGRVALKGSEIVVAHTLIAALADLDEVGKAILWVGVSADELERDLYGHHADVL